MLKSQPMGFYSASQLIQDARRHGVTVLPVDVAASEWATTLERIEVTGVTAVRLGLHSVKGLGPGSGARIAAARQPAGWRDVADLARRAALGRGELEALAAAGALRQLAGHRFGAAWAAAAIAIRHDLLDAVPIAELPPSLPAPREGQDLVADYASQGFTLGRHPLLLLRQHLDRRYVTAQTMRGLAHHAPVRCVGLVTCRQRPGTAAGVIFLTLEDETGLANVVVQPRLAERQRQALLGARLLGVLGVLQRQGEVVHLLAKRLVDHSPLLGALVVQSRDFC
jgi:error-prone DNA polymerase